MLGTISGRNVPIQFRFAIMTKEATSDPDEGRIIVPSRKVNSPFFQGNSNLAKVKPASEQKKSTSTVTTTATSSVLKKFFRKSIFFNTFPILTSRVPPKITFGGTR